MQSWRQTFEKVDRRLLIGAVLALVLLGFSGFLSFRNARLLIAATSRVNGIHANLANENDLIARLNQAEGSMFGYVITGDTNFLRAYHAATNSLPDIVSFVRLGVEGNADAEGELLRLDGLIAERLAQMRHRIQVRATQGLEAVRALIQSGEAQRIMDQVRTSIAILQQFETQRLGEMEGKSMSSARTTLVVDILFGSVSVLALAIILAWVMRENVTRRETEEQLRKAGRELEMRVAQRTADLAAANARLEQEILDHKSAEEAVRASERKLAEAAEALADKNRDLEMLIYVASHDLRAPLLNIRGFVSELMRSCVELQSVIEKAGDDRVEKAAVLRAIEDMPESAGFIQTGVARMDALLSGFLRLSRLGRAALRISRVDMNALVHSIAESFAFQMREAGAEINVDRLPRCSADATQLTQVFSNLIDNSLKYRDPQRPLRVELTGHVESGMVAYRLTDNGSGIPAEHLEKVFEIFHRVNPRESEGEGLGLTIARRILDRLHGRISVQSTVGEGSVFTVYLPAAERDGEAMATVDAQRVQHN